MNDEAFVHYLKAFGVDDKMMQAIDDGGPLHIAWVPLFQSLLQFNEQEMKGILKGVEIVEPKS